MNSDATEGRAGSAPDGKFGGAILVALLAAAFGLRLGVAARMPIIEVDGAYWCGLARNLYRGQWDLGLHAAWPPGYPSLIAAVSHLFPKAGGWAPDPGTLEWSARWVSLLAGTLLLLPLRSIARRLLPGRWWIAVVGIAAVHPRLVEYSAAALAESLFTFLIVGGLAVLLCGESGDDAGASGGAAWHVVGGIAFGLAFMVRPEALPLGVALWIGAALWRRGAGGRGRVDFALAMILVALPWMLFLHHRTGGWTLGEKGTYNFWRAHREAYARHFPPPVVLPQRVNRSPEIAPPPARDEVRPLVLLMAEPGAVIGKSLRNLGTLLVSTYPVTVGWPVALLALAGLLIPRAGPWWVVWMPMAIAPLLFAPFSVDRRFLVPMVPMAVILAGASLAALGRKLRGWPVPAFAVALSLGLLAYAWGIPGRADRAPEQRLAGERLGRWIADDPGLRDRPGGRDGEGIGRPRPAMPVMARKPWVAYYAGRPIADLPDVPIDSLVTDARRSGVAFLLADLRSARADRPQLREWLGRASPPPGAREWTGSGISPDTLRIFYLPSAVPGSIR